jgi:hypothetical protein
MKDIEWLSDCTNAHQKKYLSLSEKERNKKHTLPCGCEEVALKDLIESYVCEGCDEVYFYSFCLKEVVDENSFWHCKACNTCRETNEWHCKKCNDCTYGLTLPCDRCGKKSPYPT